MPELEERNDLTFEDWISGGLEKYRKWAQLPKGLAPHALVESFADGEFEKIDSYQVKAFHQLAEIVAYFEKDRFLNECINSPNIKVAVNKKIEQLNTIMRGSEIDTLEVFKGEVDTLGFGPDSCERVFKIQEDYHNPDFDTWEIVHVRPVNNELFNQTVNYRLIQKLEQVINEPSGSEITDKNNSGHPDSPLDETKLILGLYSKDEFIRLVTGKPAEGREKIIRETKNKLNITTEEAINKANEESERLLNRKVYKNKGSFYNNGSRKK